MFPCEWYEQVREPMTGREKLAAETLTNSVYRDNGVPRHDTREASIQAYQYALQKIGFDYEEVAALLARF
jgi:hypothetical protein